MGPGQRNRPKRIDVIVPTKTPEPVNGALEHSTGLDVLNTLGTELQGLREAGVDAGPVN